MCVRETLDEVKAGDVVSVSTYSVDWFGFVVENSGRMLTLESLDRSVKRSFSHYDISEITVDKAVQA